MIYRNSGNYYAGDNTEVLYSQYEKFNISATGGVRTSEKGAIIGSFIYDRANDIGYPALTMDVSLARAVVGSVAYEHKELSDEVSRWESKFYFNSIKHVMDDTNRPDVPIHMDMPGWSDTYGFYSKMNIEKKKHKILVNFNAYYNKSLAEMTMYPEDPEENLMFMLTWPDVRTMNTGAYGEDSFSINDHGILSFSGRLAYQHERIADEFGLNSLKIFYPDMDDQQDRFLINLSTAYKIENDRSIWLFSAGYGQRAPSVSEAYGFFLYNSYDNFDYIGNPYLKNEKSAEINGRYDYAVKKFKVGAEASYFYMPDYIIGEIDPEVSPMTIGAEGVKIYSRLNYASIFNAGVNLSYEFLNSLTWAANVGYNLGQDDGGNNLPLISPIQYGSSLSFKKGMVNAAIDMLGATEHTNYAPVYGESPKEAYTIFNINAGSSFYFGSQKLLVKGGIENIFDVFYSTYADWNGIPRKGRNVFLNISYVIK